MRDYAAARGSSARLPWLAYLIFAHILILTFQLPLRQVIVDSTYWRDVLLVVILALWFVQRLQAEGITLSRRLFSPGGWVFLIVVYGLVVVVVQLLNDVELILALRDFRNQFLPLALFFVAQTVFENAQRRARLVNFIFYLMCVLAVGILIEELASLSGVSMSVFPWYQYSFINRSHFIGNAVGMEGYVRPEDSPVLGILGWPHETSAYFLALFAVCMPYVLSKPGGTHSEGAVAHPQGLKSWLQTVLLLQCIAVLVILGTKTTMIAFLSVCVLYMFVFRNRALWRRLLPIALIVTTVLIASERYRTLLVMKIQQGFLGLDDREAIVSVIFDPDVYRGVIDTLSNASMEYVLFGGYDFSDYWFFVQFEIRLIFFALKYGAIWLLLFLGLIGSVLWSCAVIVRRNGMQQSDRLFGLGCLTMMVVYCVDLLHYGRIMDWPSLDTFAVVMGAMSSIRRNHRAPSPEVSIPLGMSGVAVRLG